MRAPSWIRARRRRGSVVMQVGIALPLLTLATVGVLELGRVLWARSTLQFATEETARHAMVSTGWTVDSLTAMVRGRVTGLNPAQVTVSVVPETVSGVSFVRITASIPQSFVSFLGLNAVTVTGRARVPTAT